MIPLAGLSFNVQATTFKTPLLGNGLFGKLHTHLRIHSLQTNRIAHNWLCKPYHWAKPTLQIVLMRLEAPLAQHLLLAGLHAPNHCGSLQALTSIAL